jgi:hypothetical protein
MLFPLEYSVSVRKINSLPQVEPEGSEHVMPKLIIGHNPEPGLFTFHPCSLSP